ncbi:hypothetical protein KQI38_11725 [Tissierella carlieri]|nr:hypothetical protein [Tissierella carlieri]MBU5312705.1 hypothetical protein [Tissierella carlieri]
MGSDKEIRKGNYSDFKGLKRRGKEKGYKKAGEFMGFIPYFLLLLKNFVLLIQSLVSIKQTRLTIKINLFHEHPSNPWKL